MKNQFPYLMFLLVAALFLGSCGEKQAGNKTEAAPEKKADPELEKHIDALAACEQQNIDCDAYNKASEYIQAQCKDEQKCKTVVEGLFIMIEKGPSGKSQAAAHAANFWTNGSFRENAAYGHIVLNALKKEKYEQNNYAGAQLGQLLAGWINTSDEQLGSDIMNAIKDKNIEQRGRIELIRLAPSEALGKNDFFNMLTAIINDADENKDVRIQALNVLWRTQNEDLKASTRSMYEGMLSNPDILMAGSSMLGLGYLKSYASYETIEKKLTETKDNQDWCYYGSYVLSELLRDSGDNMDKNKVFTLVKMLISNKNVTAYYRSYYVSTLIAIDNAASKGLLNQLKASGEKEIVDEINQRMTK
ncbi:MAG: hypothetical protein ACOZCO_13495 [Bacteroidota bacterium]